MKKILAYGITAATFFGIAFTVSWFNRGSRAGTAEMPQAQGVAIPKRREYDKRRDPAQLGSPTKASALRPPYVAGAEETTQLAANLRDRLTAVKEKESQLEDRQKHLELIYQDIRTERSAIEDLRRQAADELRLVDQKIAAVQQKRETSDPAPIPPPRATAESTSISQEVTAAEQDNFRKMGDLLGGMAADSAAKILKQLSERGKLDTAAKLLANMSERQAAKVLSEIADLALAGQLVGRMNELKQQPMPEGK
jgi:flagellar motility protein MotE (MotC chaperone)